MVTAFEATLRQATEDLDSLGARWAMIGGAAAADDSAGERLAISCSADPCEEAAHE